MSFQNMIFGSVALVGRESEIESQSQKESMWYVMANNLSSSEYPSAGLAVGKCGIRVHFWSFETLCD